MADTGTATPALLRRLNAERVLGALRGERALNVAELVQRSGLSRATLDAVVDDLIRIGYVGLAQATVSGARGRGRPQRWLRFRSEAGYTVGVDIGAHRLEVVVTDLAGEVCAGRGVVLTPELPRAHRMREARQAIRSALRDARADASEVRAIGVGTPGIVDRQTGFVRHCNAMADWSGFALSAAFERSFGCATIVENDANLAAVGERWRGVAQERDDVVFLLAGERVGTGIVLGGELVRGSRGGTGEMTFLGLVRTPDPSEPIEQLVLRIVDETIDGLIERREVRSDAVRVLMRDLAPMHGVVVTDLERWLGAVQAGRVSARGELRTALGRFCRVSLVVATLISPQLFVIGGQSSAAATALLPPVRAVLGGLAGSGVEPPEVAASTLGERAVALGAVRTALDVASPRLLDTLG